MLFYVFLPGFTAVFMKLWKTIIIKKKTSLFKGSVQPNRKTIFPYLPLVVWFVLSSHIIGVRGIIGVNAISFMVCICIKQSY